MLTAVNLQRAVTYVLRVCGDDGPGRALDRARERRAQGRHHSAEIWKDIARAAACQLAERAAPAPA